ncbi:hypothetical protein MKW92_042145 [Papaver armeniacum]|nr:hypothetical protein MKW92_042145 [Papaver armeniacum]
MLDTAKSLIEKAKVKNVALHFPTDVVIADQFAPDAASKVLCDVPNGWMGLDIGSDTVKAFSEHLDTAKTVVWNGSMGEYNMEKFVVGTDVCVH